MEHPIPLEQLRPELRKVCDPAAPAPARMMAAKGLVPLGPADLLTVLYQLAHDADGTVSSAARAKSKELPENIVGGALASDLDARILDFYAVHFLDREKLLEVMLLNKATADETVARVARRVTETTAEVIATNEQRLLRTPKIIEELYHNPKARMSTVNRAIELAVRSNIVLDGIAAYREVAAAIKGELIIEEEGPTPGDLEFHAALSLGEAIEAEANQYVPDPETEHQDPLLEKRKSLYAQLAKKSATEKIRLAMIGTPAIRAILVRDSNRLVAAAAIKSPGVSDQEVVAYARNRALAEEVIRFIADRRDWTKLYQVKLFLAENPKTPLPRALSFLTHLRQNDLRDIARSKNVAQAVAQAARNQLSKRQ